VKNNKGLGKKDRGEKSEWRKEKEERIHEQQTLNTLHQVSAPLITAPLALRGPLCGPSKQMMKKKSK